MDNISKYLKKSFFTGSVKTIVVTLSTLALLPLIIEKLGMSRYGLISITMLFGGGVTLVDLGISKAVTLLIGKTEVQKNKNEIVADAFFLTFTILSICGILAISSIIFNLPVLGTALGIEQSLYNYIIFAGYLTLFIMMVNNLLVAILDAYLLMHFVNIGFGLSSVLFNVLLLIVGLFDASNYVLVSIPFFSFFLITIYYLLLINRKTDLRVALPDISRAKRIIPISAKFLSISLVSSVTTPINKYVLLLLTGNPVVIGVFDVALKIAFLANSLLNNLAQPLFGVFSKMSNEANKVFTLAKRTSIIIFIMYVTGVIIYVFCGQYFMSFLDSQNSALLFEISLILLIGVSFNAVSEPFFRAYLGLSHLKKAMYCKSTILFFNIILFFLLKETDAINRVSFSYSISITLSGIVIIIFGLVDNKRLHK